ncbi:Major sperm protein 1 [Trichinella zimbabwensis]|uniref:Major sperm protein n=1 Tax=Trichinella zimbabwensis TaxID=268475 RepID=A0A0V1I9W1_9BILA|nr:Major sperm protein 1 [Trichinella zimbabwensis]
MAPECDKHPSGTLTQDSEDDNSIVQNIIATDKDQWLFPYSSEFVANMPKPIPSELKTSPAERIVFNGPFEEKKNYPFSITNNGKEKIAYMIKLSNETRTMCDPSHGVLDPGENVWIRVHLEAFQPTVENTQPNTLTIEYCLPPEGSDKNFNPNWFRLNVIIRRKHVALEYNA